jgi:hypothetical protein
LIFSGLEPTKRTDCRAGMARCPPMDTTTSIASLRPGKLRSESISDKVSKTVFPPIFESTGATTARSCGSVERTTAHSSA